MHSIEEGQAVSSGGFGQELRHYWGKLPDRGIFIVLIAAWCLLFYYCGWTSAIAGRTSSLYQWMWIKWSDPANDASHGKLIPWVVLAIIWLRRRRLIDSVKGVWWPGLIGLAVALLLHVVGYLVQQPRFSMVALFFGGWNLVGLVWGPEALKVTFFPFFLFGFCVPMGGTFAQELTVPLRFMAAKGAMFVSHTILDIPVIREGTILKDPNGVYGRFDVAAECSGIRSFTALLAITTIFSVLTMRTWWKRALMIASTIPLAVICNVIRLTVVIMTANFYQSQQAGATVHDYFGYVSYAIAIGCVLLLAKLLKDKPEAPAPP